MQTQKFGISREVLDHKVPERSILRSQEGINEGVVKLISKDKNEPEWMLKKRLHSLKLFFEKPMPDWGPSLEKLDFNKIVYYIKTSERYATDWNDVPPDIKEIFDKLGIPEVERKYLGGSGAQWESSIAYHNLKKEWSEKGVIFEDMDVALQKYPNLVKEYFMTRCVPITDHKFASLHGACWSGGTFIFVPKNVKVTVPLQAYFRMNSRKAGQFEHTLIIVDEGAELHYLESCSAPQYNESSIHAGCVEIFVKKGARCRYSSVENWSRNTFNLNTKRAIVEEDGIIEFVNGNLGSGVTMLYPCSVLIGKNARSDFIGIAFAGQDQNQDTGHKVYHLADNTKSTVQSKSISKNNGITTYRGVLKIKKGAKNCKSNVQCDALMLDQESKSDTIPHIEVNDNTADIGHEATTGKISEEQIFYLQSRGLSKDDARKMVVSGFIEPMIKELPGEYALELNRLIDLEMEGSVG